MPNRLTFLYSKIYYKKKNYLKVKTAVFKYIGWYKYSQKQQIVSKVVQRDNHLAYRELSSSKAVI